MKLSKAPFVFATLLAASSASYAATVTLNDSVVLSNNANNVINILKFDTANDIDPSGDSTVGATLTNVEITVTVSLDNASVQMDNDNDDAGVNTATAIVQNQVNTFTVGNVSDDPLDAIDLQLNEQQNFNLTATTGDALGFTNTGLGDYATWSPGLLTASTNGSYNGAVADLFGYTTTTLNEVIVFTLNPTFSTSATFSGANGFFQGNTPAGTYDVEVVYTYTPVPEVSSFALLSGLCALGFIALRRR